MKTDLRASTFFLFGLALTASPLASGCGGDDPQNTGGNTTTSSQGGGGSGGTPTTTGSTNSSGGGGNTSTGGGGTGGTTSSGGGGTGGTGGASSGGGGTGGASSGGGGTGGTGGTTSTGGGGEGGTTTTTDTGTTTTSTTTTTTSSSTGIDTGNYDCTPPTGAIPNLKRTTIAMGLDKPVYVRAAPGDSTRLYIVEQSGRIKIMKNGVMNAEAFLNISDRVHQPGFGDERGLLGLAFHPDYQQNGRFFVYYTKEQGTPGNQVLAEYSRSQNNPDLATAAGGFGTEVAQLFEIPDFESNHNGGVLEFSPVDGYLYIGTGDGGGADDNIFDSHAPFGNAQNLEKLWGKVLRLDVNNKEGGKNYAIPTGNLTAIPANNPSAGVLPEIWDYGLRNPWRISFDPCNGNLYIGDVGQYNWEEVDIEAPGMGNKNYGWVYKEGNANKYPNLVGNNQTLTPPVDEYSHAAGNCSITGGFVYRGSAIPSLRGRYFYGDYCSGKVWSFVWNGSAIQDKIDHTADLGAVIELTSWGYDNEGNLYMTRANGQVQRLDVE